MVTWKDADRQDGEKFPAAIAGQGIPGPDRLGSCSKRTVCVARTHGSLLFSSCKYLSRLTNYFLNHFGLQIESYPITLPI